MDLYSMTHTHCYFSYTLCVPGNSQIYSNSDAIYHSSLNWSELGTDIITCMVVMLSMIIMSQRYLVV